MTGKDSLKDIMHSVWIRSVKAEIRTKVKLTSPGTETYVFLRWVSPGERNT